MKRVYGADPFVLFDKKSGAYYCYSTSNSESSNQFYLDKSYDLKEWTRLGYALDCSKNCWGKDWFWAPECYYNENNGYYYLFYSARVKDELTEEYFNRKDYLESAKIGVAVSKSPEGPFVNISDRPFDFRPYDEEYINIEDELDDYFVQNPDPEIIKKAKRGQYISMIDANLYFEDGHIYLFYSRCCYKQCHYDEKLEKFIEESSIDAVELDPSFWYDKEAKTMPKALDKYLHVDENGIRKDRFVKILNYANQPQEWENGHAFDHEKTNGELPNRRWTEGSTTICLTLEGKKTYCMTYSCNNYLSPLYGIGIAFSDNPLGPYIKYENNPIIAEKPAENVYSTGHGSIVRTDGIIRFFFHYREDFVSDRSFSFAQLFINNRHNVQVGPIEKCVKKEIVEVK